MLGTSVQEVLQDCDERMGAHRYTYTWLIYDMYNMIMNMMTLVLILIFEYVITLDHLQTCFITGFWKGTNHAVFKSRIHTKKVIEFLLSM